MYVYPAHQDVQTRKSRVDVYGLNEMQGLGTFDPHAQARYVRNQIEALRLDEIAHIS